MIDTNETLLERVKSMDAHSAWQEFYKAYWSAILRYARKLGLNQHQAEEVLQETMVTLMRQLPGFTYDRRKGKFRNFLLTIVHRKSLAALRRTKRESESRVPWEENAAGDDQVLNGTNDPAANAAATRWRESILEAVLGELAADARLGCETMAVFRAYVVQGKPAGEVAAAFGLKENAVYQIKNRLARRVQERVACRLRDSDAGLA
jgi:RNA polymerase sigma-70 factor (ECF subfamily)